MSDLAPFLLLLGLVGQGCLLGANLFEAVVDVPNWSRPGGVAAYRAFTTTRNAGHFYRVLSPIVIVLLAAALATGWGTTTRNALVGAALIAAVLAEVFTVAYFFPRNARLFFAPEPPAQSEQLRLVGQWGRANLVRCALVGAGLFAGMSAGLGLAGS
jgi:hypothetical protein